MTLEKRTIWTGRHEGVPFEIGHKEHRENSPLVSWHPAGIWTHYVYINEESVPPEFRKDIFLRGSWMRTGSGRPWWHHKYTEGLLASLDWHCGITFYEVLYPHGPKHNRAVKAGCDYQHLWDEGNHYSLEHVEREARRTIESLLESVPLLRRCDYDGVFRDRTKGKLHGESWYSDEGEAKRVAKEIAKDD